MNATSRIFERQDRKTILSTVWVFLAANYIYCDVLSHMQPAALQELITGRIRLV